MRRAFSEPQVVVDLDVERPHRHAEQVVGADGEDDIEQLLGLELGSEDGPGRVGDTGVYYLMERAPGLAAS